MFYIALRDMPIDSLIWWLIVLLNISGYFAFRLGMALETKVVGFRYPATPQIIQFGGGIVVLTSFGLMFLVFGIWQTLLLIPIFWFGSTPTGEILLTLLKINDR